jgi:BirA family biotin operon repressor/biotin-[acetyl-CoA-carboxylase] ligase
VILQREKSFMSIDLLLPVLADGEYHSGEELGGVLGVSRAAVWKQIKKIEELLGFSLESVKGKGYRIVGGLDLLNKGRVEDVISQQAASLLSQLDLLAVTESTNRIAMDKALVGSSSGYVCVAEKQTAGRGRRGRVWHSPYGRNLYFSLLWEFTGGAAALEGLSLAVGVAVVEVFESIGIADVELKWPNDLLYQGKKLAGILLEMTGDAAGVCQVVVGVGINVDMSDSVTEQIDQPWVDLQSLAADGLSRNVLLGLLLDKLLLLLSTYEEKGFSAYREQWLKKDAFASQSVSVQQGQSLLSGVARGVDAAGALQLEMNGEIKTFNGGEVSLRKSK